MSHSNLKTIAAKKKRKLESQDYVNFRCLQCKNEVFLISSWVRVGVFCSKCRLEMQKVPMRQDNLLQKSKNLTTTAPNRKIDAFCSLIVKSKSPKKLKEFKKIQKIQKIQEIKSEINNN